MAEQVAITESGALKPVSEFTRAEKWWCDGEDCGGCGIPGPHVHPYDSLRIPGGALPVDLLTGMTVKPAEDAP